MKAYLMTHETTTGLRPGHISASPFYIQVEFEGTSGLAGQVTVSPFFVPFGEPQFT